MSAEAKTWKVEYNRAYNLANKEGKAEYNKAYYQANKEKLTEDHTAYRAANKEKITEYSEAYRADNKEKIAERDRAYRAANKEKTVEYSKAYFQANRDKVNTNTAKRRASKLDRTVAWSDADAIKALYTEARRLTEETGEQHHVDHIIPLQGELVSGLHVENNLQVLSAYDNLSKANKFNMEEKL